MKVYQRKHKLGTRWCCDFHVIPAGEQLSDRFRLTAPAGVASKAGAERWAKQQYTDVAVKGRPPNTKTAKAQRADLAAQAERDRVPTLGEWYPQYEEQLALERRKESGQVTRRFQFAWLQPFVALDLRACCSELVVRRLRANLAASPKKLSPTYANSVVGLLLSCLRRAAVEMPHLGLVIPTVRPIRVDAVDAIVCYPLADTIAILEACGSQARACVLLMLDAGLRAGEVCALRWADINAEALLLTVRGTTFKDQVTPPKSGKPRTVPLTRRLAAALTDYAFLGDSPWVFPAKRRDGPGVYDTLVALLENACTRAGVPCLGCHPLRHTYATESLRTKEVDLRTLQDRLGHSSISITAGYLHASDPSARVGVDAFEARMSAPATVTDLALARQRKIKT